MTKSDEKNFRYDVIKLLEKHIVQMKGGTLLENHIRGMESSYQQIIRGNNFSQYYIHFYGNYVAILNIIGNTNNPEINELRFNLLKKKMEIDELFLKMPDTFQMQIYKVKQNADNYDFDIKLITKLLEFYYKKLLNVPKILKLLKGKNNSDLFSKIDKNFNIYFKLYGSLLNKNVDNNTTRKIMEQKEEIDSIYRIFYSKQIISNDNELVFFTNNRYKSEPNMNNKMSASNLISNLNRGKYEEYKRRAPLLPIPTPASLVGIGNNGVYISNNGAGVGIGDNDNIFNNHELNQYRE